MLLVLLYQVIWNDQAVSLDLSLDRKFVIIEITSDTGPGFLSIKHCFCMKFCLGSQLEDRVNCWC